MKHTQPAMLFLVVTFAATSVACSAERPVSHWPQFRGPGGNAAANGQSVPLNFGPNREMRWRTALPTGHSSPCVWGDRVFLTGYEGTTLKMICLDSASGRILWERERKIAKLTTYVHVAGSPANPTPAADGSRVVFVLDDYGVIVTDLNGELLWEKKLPPTENEYSYGASPILDKDRIYLNRDSVDESCLLCLDASTGNERWKAPRPATAWGFGSPYLFDQNGTQLVLVGGTGRLAAYNAENGDPIWHVTGLPSFVCPSPAVDGNMIFFGGWATAHVAGRTRVESVFDEDSGVPPAAMQDAGKFFERYDLDNDQRLTRQEFPRGRARDSFPFTDENKDGYVDIQEWATIYNENPSLPGRNVLLGIAGGGSGDVTDKHVRWEITKGLPYVASPLAYGGRVYLVAQGGFVTCVDAQSGHAHFTKQRLGVGGEYYASPVAVGDHILVCARRGPIFIIKVDDHLEVVHRTDLGEAIFATPAVASNTLFIRGENHLWAFGN